MTAAFQGNGLRPYAVAHLRADGLASSLTRLTWIRRTRRGGDTWQSLEVPLAEEVEQYAIEVIKDGNVRRTLTTVSTTWDYTLAMQTADLVTKPFTLRVAQLSQAYGAGPFREIAVLA